jgi:hypothetical protein
MDYRQPIFTACANCGSADHSNHDARLTPFRCPCACHTCSICTRPANDPYRVYDTLGNVLAGCVAAQHTGHLVTPSASAWWHNRPEAKEIRRRLRNMQFGA